MIGGMMLLSAEALDVLQRAERQGWSPSAEDVKAFNAGAFDASPRVSKGVGVATIPVVGPLVPGPSLAARVLFGSFTTYGEIVRATLDAAADPNVQTIVFDFDSPGGSTHGLFEALAAIESVKKRKVARVAQAQSAAYGLAAMCDRIEATTEGAFLGSIGVAAAYRLDDRIIDLTNTASPDKRPDLRTDEGKATVRKTLDAIHQLFVEAIARGRKTTVANINATYGRGATLTARQALKLGMIDAVVGSSTATRTTSNAHATGDLGDQIVALLEAETRGEQVHVASEEPSGETDIGDAVVALLAGERAHVVH